MCKTAHKLYGQRTTLHWGHPGPPDVKDRNYTLFVNAF
jgi:hypothetical protein